MNARHMLRSQGFGLILRTMVFALRLIVLLIAATALTAAADPANWEDAEKGIVACFQAMDRDPALAVVNAKFARRSPSSAQLNDRTFANEDETAALRLRVQKTRPCRELRLAAVNSHHPLLEPAYATLYYQADQVFDYLQQGAISYGAANGLSAEALSFFQAREKAYFAASADERAALANDWSEDLQRGHSNPPPPPSQICWWQGLNILCQ